MLFGVSFQAEILVQDTAVILWNANIPKPNSQKEEKIVLQQQKTKWYSDKGNATIILNKIKALIDNAIYEVIWTDPTTKLE